jgi:hypothetical protein
MTTGLPGLRRRLASWIIPVINEGKGYCHVSVTHWANTLPATQFALSGPKDGSVQHYDRYENEPHL